jgi:hypothetical protein
MNLKLFSTEQCSSSSSSSSSEKGRKGGKIIEIFIATKNNPTLQYFSFFSLC